MKINNSYKYCSTYKTQCKNVRHNGTCSNKHKEKCIFDRRMNKDILKGVSYIGKYF